MRRSTCSGYSLNHRKQQSSSVFGTRLKKRYPYSWSYPYSIKTRCRISRRQPLCQKHLDHFICFDTIPACEGRTNDVTLLLWRSVEESIMFLYGVHVCLSVGPVFFLTLIGLVAHTQRDSSGVACDAASVHFCPTIKRMNKFVLFCLFGRSCLKVYLMLR